MRDPESELGKTMPLVLDPGALPHSVLTALRDSLHADLVETQEWVQHPDGQVRDPASIQAAGELLRSTLARLDVEGSRTPESLGADVNLAYATLVAVVDLVKSHTDGPIVPRKRGQGPDP